MAHSGELDRCLTFINCQMQSPPERGARPAAAEVLALSVTLSRQTGTGGRIIARSLAAYLEKYDRTTTAPWTVFDKNLVETVLEHHHLPKSLAKYMPEDRVSQLDDITQELVGLRPASWTLREQVTSTMLHLAELGNVILVGRGGAIIARKLRHVFHVRLVGSLEARLEHVRKYDQLGREAALKFLKQEDRGRARYLKQQFHRDVEDPLLYDLIVNTDRLQHEHAAKLIGDVVLSRSWLR